MIRVNLLRNRKEGLQRLVAEPRGASSFISGREVLLAGLFLVLGGAILWFVLGRQAGSDEAAASGNAEPAVSSSVGEASALPAEDVARGTSLTTVQSPPPASQLPASPTTAAPTTGAVGPRGSTLLSSKSSVAAAQAARTAVQVARPLSSGGVITMSGLRILGEGNSLQILAATDGRPDYKMFRVDNPDRIVIDLAGVRHEISREYREQTLSNSIVKTVRVAQNQIEPPMVRLVLEVESFPELQILPRPDGLLINVTGK